MEIVIDTIDRSYEVEGDGVALGGGVGDGDDLEGDDLGEGVGDGDDINTITPKVGMEFPTHEDAYKFYNRYALKMGFGTRRSTSMKSRSDPHLVISKRFVCSKEGKRRPLKNPIGEEEEHHRREIRVECKAMMKIILTESRSWRVSVFVPEHNNHELSSPSKAMKYRSHKKVHRQPIVQSLITQLHSEGISNANIARVVNAFEAHNTWLHHNKSMTS